MTIDDLNRRFALSGILRFDAGGGGLPRARVSHPAATGEMYLHGAHVADWQPRGERPVLWMSRRSQFEAGKPIRGGVPICFPWFGPRRGDSAAPAHGLARLTAWDVEAADADGHGVTVRMGANLDEGYRLTFAARFAAELTLTLTVDNTADTPASFEAALHSYFAVSDIRGVRVTGLEQAAFLDQLADRQPVPPTGSPVTFAGETDRIYLHDGSATIEDSGWDRAIQIRKSHSANTVVWNPWIAKAARMPDFGDDEWPGMLCVETANIGDRAVTLPPAGRSTMAATVSVARPGPERTGLKSVQPVDR